MNCYHDSHCSWLFSLSNPSRMMNSDIDSQEQYPIGLCVAFHILNVWLFPPLSYWPWCVCIKVKVPAALVFFPGLKWMGVCLLLCLCGLQAEISLVNLSASDVPDLFFLSARFYRLTFPALSSLLPPCPLPLWALSLPAPPCPLCSDPEPHCHTNNSLGTLTLLVSVM